MEELETIYNEQLPDRDAVYDTHIEVPMKIEEGWNNRRNHHLK